MTVRIIHNLTQAQYNSRAYVTIGVFDGIHRGHQQLVGGMVKAAHSAGNVAVVVTFDPHPVAALGYDPPPLMTTVEERAELLAPLELDLLVALPFTRATAHTSATDFVELLLQHLGLLELWGGPDFALGHRREGDIPFLRRLGAERGFTVHTVEPLVWEGGLISSSRVRAALEAGDIPQATGCLGHPYRLVGVVVQGRGMGHSLGTPTANLSIQQPERLLPAGGVYACVAHTERPGAYPAVVNVGVRPTFAGRTLTVEAHLLDSDADLYDQRLALDFIARLRDERSFSTADALVEQIHKDIAQARDVLGVDAPSTGCSQEAAKGARTRDMQFLAVGRTP